MNVSELQTPCLLLDRRVLGVNLARMAAFFEGRRARLRPHFKSHKCATIARKQLAAGGCSGISCATVGEAEVLVAAGIGDVLVANQIAPDKAARLVALNRSARVRVCVDDPRQIKPLSAAAAGSGVALGVLVELDVGMGRCGARDSGVFIEVARAVRAAPGLEFEGIQAYEGHAVLEEDPVERARRARGALEKSKAARDLLEAEGVPVGTVSSAGTGTYDITGAAGHVDEVQAGSYALMDAKYRAVRPEFGNALFILASCVSVRGDRAVFDVGLKGCGGEFGPPELAGLGRQPGLRKLSEEHFIVGDTAERFEVGGKYRLVPGHGCTTCNLYPEFRVVEGDEVVDAWKIEASGLRT